MIAKPTDASGPWTIKAISLEARDLAVIAARQANLTTGQWLEKTIRDAVARTDVSLPSPKPETLSETVRTLHDLGLGFVLTTLRK